MSRESRDWIQVIPQDERVIYDNAGYGSADSIEGNVALLVIDATRNFTGSQSMPTEEAMHEFPTSCGEVAWAALPYVRELLDAFRSSGRHVVYTARDVPAQNAAKGSSKRSSAGHKTESGNDWVELVAPAEDEWVCRKSRASAFYGTALDAYLRMMNAQTLVICGSTTSGCVRASTTDAYSTGLRVVVAEDACWDRARTPHLVNLFDMNAKYATVLSTRAIVEGLKLLGDGE